MCALERQLAELRAGGWVKTSVGYIDAFLECGVEVVTIRLHEAWVPAWAEVLREQLWDAAGGAWSVWLKPILVRAAIDSEFAQSCLTLLDLHTAGKVPQDERSFRERLAAFAYSQGVRLK